MSGLPSISVFLEGDEDVVFGGITETAFSGQR
jgi:hypothetical protein